MTDAPTAIKTMMATSCQDQRGVMDGSIASPMPATAKVMATPNRHCANRNSAQFQSGRKEPLMLAGGRASIQL
jgi:hypothetical protein